MIKRLLNVLVLTLAMNFLLAAGGVGWLFQSGHLDKTKVAAIREVVFPTVQPAAPATQPATATPGPTTRPLLRLDELLAKHAGRRAGEQVEVIQQTVDTQTAVLDRRAKEVEYLQTRVAAAQKKLADASTALTADRRQLDDQKQQAAQAAGDKGFDDSLKLYSAMPPKQVKAVFMGLPEDAVVRFLQAMPPRTATKIVKEFKAPDEAARINRVLERMRQGQAFAGGGDPGDQPATRPAVAGGPGAAGP